MSVDNPKFPEVPPDTVIITVGNVKITEREFDQLIDSLQPQYRAAARGANRKQFADNVVQMITLAQEAEHRKLNDNPEFQTRARFQSYNLLANEMVEQIGKEVQVTDADLRQYYDAHKGDFQTVHAKHILIRFKGSQVPLRPGEQDLSDADALAKAQEIRKKIQGGADFGEVAKQESDDVASGAKGGELAAFKHGQMVPAFETAAFAMKAGELSEPVKSQYGYHIILVVPNDTKSFDEVRPDLEKTVKPQETQKAIAKTLQDLEKATPPVLNPVFFAPPAPATPAPSFTPVPGTAPVKK